MPHATLLHTNWHAACMCNLLRFACMQGLERTRGSVVQKEFQDILKAGNIEEIRDVLDDVHEALMELDIFEDVDMSIEASQKVSTCQKYCVRLLCRTSVHVCGMLVRRRTDITKIMKKPL